MKKTMTRTCALFLICLLQIVPSGILPLAGARDTHPAGTRSLADLEAAIKTAPQVLIAMADLEEKLNRLEHIQARSGLLFRGTTGIGYTHELSGANSTRDFSNVMAGMGLRYPLLGLYEKDKMNIATAEARVLESRHRADMARLESLRLFRMHYVDYWGSLEKIALSRAFVDRQQEIEQILADRTQKGLMLDSDYQVFLSAFALARRNILRMQVISRRSHRILALMTQPDLEAFIPDLPMLPAPCQDLEKIRSGVLETNPDIRLYQSLVDEQLGLLGMTRNGSLDAYLDLGGYTSQEDAADDNEYGLALNLTITMPAQVCRANQAQRRALLAALKKARLELDQKRDLLLVDAESALSGLQSEKGQVEFSVQRLAAALEGLKEAWLRSGNMPGDTLEKLEQKRFQYYQAAMDLVDARMSLFLQQIQLLQYSPSGCEPGVFLPGDRSCDIDSILNDNFLNPLWLQKIPQTPGLPEARGTAPRTGTAAAGYGTYVWNSRLLSMDLPENSSFWQMLKNEEINRLLVSFDGRELEELRDKGAQDILKTFLETAHSKSIRVDLLLGEPLWILPEHRPALLAIIQELSKLPFQGLHLDLEPNQLDGSGHDQIYLITHLIQTLEAAKRLSPWPLGLSIHPRYLDTRQTRICLGSALTAMGLDEVTLMVYVSKPRKVAEVVIPLMERFPGLLISIAQSVESSLTRDESYARKGKTEFHRQMRELILKIHPKNFNGILIQSFSEYKRMNP